MTISKRARLIIVSVGAGLLVVSVVIGAADAPGWTIAVLRVLGVFLVVLALAAGTMPPKH